MRFQLTSSCSSPCHTRNEESLVLSYYAGCCRSRTEHTLTSRTTVLILKSAIAKVALPQDKGDLQHWHYELQRVKLAPRPIGRRSRKRDGQARPAQSAPAAASASAPRKVGTALTRPIEKLSTISVLQRMISKYPASEPRTTPETHFSKQLWHQSTLPLLA